MRNSTSMGHVAAAVGSAKIARPVRSTGRPRPSRIARRRIASAAIEALENRMLLATTPWPEEGIGAWPSFWDEPQSEIEAKWHTDATTQAQLKDDLTDLPGLTSTRTINGLTYTLTVDWSGLPRKFVDYYYDYGVNDDEMAQDMHVLRHRYRVRWNGTNPAPSFDSSISTLLAYSNWRSPITNPDYHRIQYKSTPERFGAPWFREEAGNTDMGYSQVGPALDSGTYPLFVSDWDNPMVQAEEDHPDILWRSDVDGIRDNLRVIDFRYRIIFSRGGSDLFEMSLDKVQEVQRDPAGPSGHENDAAYANAGLTTTFHEVELESLIDSETNVNELFDLRNYFQNTYNTSTMTLQPSDESKGNARVPDHGPVIIDNFDPSNANDAKWPDNDAPARNFTAAAGYTRQTDGGFRHWSFQDTDRHEITSGTSGDEAVWTFGEMSPGRYKVAATWTHGADRASAAPFQIWDDTTLVATVNVNQQTAPADFTKSGVAWRNLGDTFYISSDRLIIKVADGVTGKVVADAIRVQHVDEARLGIGFAGGALSINGTSGADAIDVSSDIGGYVLVNGQRVQTGGGELLASAVTSILVEGLEGNDDIDLYLVGAAFSALGNQVTVKGDAGNDTIEGTTRSDSLVGGTGNDTFKFAGSVALGTDIVNEATGVDVDTLDFSGLNSALTLDLALTGARVVAGALLSINLSSGSGIENAVASATGTYADSLLGNDRPNRLDGNAGLDTLRGRGGNDELHGGADRDLLVGDDTISAHGNDTLYGDSGDDDLYGDMNTSAYSPGTSYGSGHDEIHGGAGADLLIGDSSFFDPTKDGDDKLYGESENDTLWGDEGPTFDPTGSSYGMGYGDDTLDGGTHNDTIRGQKGNDTYYFPEIATQETDTLTEHSSPYGGSADLLDFSDLTSDIVINLSDSGIQQDPAPFRMLIFPSSSALQFENVKGGSGDDSITGNGSNNTLWGNNGDDTLKGEGGNDVLHGGNGVDWLFGSTGSDVLNGDADGDILHGDAGSDTINGGEGNDLLHGGLDNDTLFGNNGDDTLYGDEGTDALNGGGQAGDVLNQ